MTTRSIVRAAVVSALVATAAVCLCWRHDARPSGLDRATRTPPPGAETARQRLAQQPLYFEPNRGQLDPAIRFLSRGPGYLLRLDDEGPALTLSRGQESHTIRMDLAGSSRATAVVPDGGELTARMHYLLGRDQRRWVRDVPTYGRVRYRGVYRGIDMVLYGNEHRLEYDFDVAAGADASRIRIGFAGADGIGIDPTGRLVVRVAGRRLDQASPVAYQTMGGARVPVPARYRMADARHVAIDLGTYDHSRPLVIDPLVLGWSTYLGGQGDDWIEASALNSKGELVVVGAVNSGEATWLFTTSGQGPLGSLDAFVSRFKADGTLLSTTFIGGGGDDIASAVAIDPQDNIYITGTTTSLTFPTTANAAMPESESLQVSLSAGIPFFTLAKLPDIGTGQVGDADAFVTKLDATGFAPKYSTYLGGSPDIGVKLSFEGDLAKTKLEFEANPGLDMGSGIAVDGAGNAYVVGTTDSDAFPVTPDAFKSSLNGVLYAGDGFVTKIDTNGSGADSIKFSSYLGGSCPDEATGVALDRFGDVYVTGDSSITPFCGGFATTTGAAHETRIGGQDAFVISFVPGRSGATFSTFIGTANDDWGGRVGVDPFDNVYASYVEQTPGSATGTLHVVSLPMDGTSENWDRPLGPAAKSASTAFQFAKFYQQDLFTPGSTLLTPVFAVGNSGGPTLYQIDHGGNVSSMALPLGGGSTWAESVTADARRVIVSGGTTSTSLGPVNAAQGTLQGGADAFTADYVYNPPPKVTGDKVDGVKEGDFFEGEIASFPFTSGTGQALFDETIDYGDGTAVETRNGVSVSADVSNITAAHAYGRAGTYLGSACVQQEGTTDAPQCGQFTIQVLNVAPSVSADPTTTSVITANTPGVTFAPSGSNVKVTVSTLADFFDPGFLESHTATITWESDGQPESAQISQQPARGTIVNATHVYTSGGTKAVTVCVADQFAASGCATLSISVPAADLLITSTGPQSAAACSTITYDVKVTNNGPDTAQNVTVRHTLSDPSSMSYTSAMTFGGAGDGTVTNETRIVNDATAGEAVAADGSTAVVTAENAAHILARDPVTLTWGQTAQLATLASDAAAIQGDWLALARKGFDTSPTDHTPGYVEVYHRVNGTWTGPVQTLTPPDTDVTFGAAVGLGGSTIAVGDPDQRLGSGAVYIYAYDGTSWTFQSKVLGANANGQLGEGVAVSRDGTTVAAGGPQEVLGITPGDVRLIQRNSGTNSWVTAGVITTPVLVGNAEFGTSVAFDEEVSTPRLVIGSPQAFGVGEAFVFQLNGTAAQEVATLFPSDRSFDEQFGRSVAISANQIMVGAGARFGTETDPAVQNRAYLFSPATDGIWGQVGRFAPTEHPEVSQFFGTAVAISEGAIIIGAPGGITFRLPDGGFDTDSFGYASVYSSCMQPDGAGSISCDVGSLAPGASTEFLLSAKLGRGIGNGAAASGTGLATSGVFDPSSPDTATTTTTVTGSCDQDTTAPVVSAAVTGKKGNHGWYVGGPVTVAWTVTDIESTLTSTTGCDTGTVSDDTNGTTFTCTATSQGGTTTKSVTVRLDTQPPLITEATPTPDAASPGAYDLAFSCSDPQKDGADSGVLENPACQGAPEQLTAVEGAQGATQTFFDIAGNSTSIQLGIPTISAGLPQTVMTPPNNCSAQVTLNGTATDPFGRVLVFTWTENGTAIGSGPRPTVTLAQGVHNLMLTVTTPDGLVVSGATTVTVVDSTPPVFSGVAAHVFADATGTLTPVTVPTPTASACSAVHVTSDAPAGGFLSGNTNVFFTATEADGLSSTAVTLVTVRPRVDVGITIPPAAVVPGANSTVSFNVENKGPSAASDIVVRPSGQLPGAPIEIDSGATTCVSDGAGGQTCTPIMVLSKQALCLDDSTAGLRCVIPALDAGASTSFDLTFATPVSAPVTTLSIGATATPAETDADTSDNTATGLLTVTPEADLALALAAPASVVAGTDATYTFTVLNNGPSNSTASSVTSPLPEGVAFKSGAGCTLLPAGISCPLGELGVGQSKSFPVTVGVGSALRGTVGVDAFVTGFDTDPNNGNNHPAAAAVSITTEVSVTPALTAATALVAGATATVAATVSNAGPSDATSVVIGVNGLPRGVSIASAPAGCSMLANASGFICPATSVRAGGEPVTLPFGIAVDQFVRGSIGATLTVSDAEEAAAHAARQAFPVTVVVHPSLAVEASPTPAVAGLPLTYTIVATNDGPSGATGGTLAVPIPPDTTLTSVSGVYFAQALDAGVALQCAGTAVAQCAIPTLGVGDRAVVTVTVSVSSGALARESSLSGNAALAVAESPTPGTASLAVPLVAKADLALTSLVSQTSPVVAGATATLAATVANNGPSDASNVQLVVALPADRSWTAASPQPAGCSADATAITCAIGALASGAQAVHTFAVRIDPFRRGSVQVAARVAASEDDLNTTNNSASAALPTIAQVTLTVDLSATPNPAIAGGDLSYAIRVANLGPSGATDPTIVLTLPDGVSTAGLLDGCTSAGRVVTCAIDNLAPDADHTVTVATVVDQFARGAQGALAATATVTSAETSTGASASLSTPLTTRADLSVSIEAAPNPIVAGSFLTYTIVAANAGPSGSIAPTLTLTLQSGVMFVSAKGAGSVCSNAKGLVTCTLPNLARGDSTTITIVATPSVAGLVSGTADIAPAEHDPDLSNNTAIATAMVSSPSAGPAGLGDFNGDGALDLAVSDPRLDVVHIFLNDGHGRFVETQQIAVGRQPNGLAIGDLDGDGHIDIAVADQGSDAVSLLLNDGAGTFHEAARVPTLGSEPSEVALGDFDGDGRLDVAVTNYQSDSVSLLARSADGWTVVQNLAVSLDTSRRHPQTIAAADFNGDGRIDVIVGNKDQNSVTLLVNLGGWQFAPPSEMALHDTDQPLGFAVADFNGDGALDVAVAGKDKGGLALLLNQNGALVETPMAAPIEDRPVAISAGDLNSDGAIDLAVAAGDDAATLMNAAGTFPQAGAALLEAAPKKTIALMIGDVNGDGGLDLVLVDDELHVSVLVSASGPAE